MLKVKNKEARRMSTDVVLLSLLLTRNMFFVNSISHFIGEFL